MENKDLSKIKWGEIYTCDLGKMKGSVQCGVRPVLVVQTNKLNGSSPTVVVAVITSVRKREDIASHIPLETDCGLNEPSMVMLVAGKMRVMIESFEKWYANQLHYKKVNGELPGAELLKRTMTVPTMASLLGIREATAYELIHRLHFRSVKTEYSSQRLLIDKATFYEWLENQTHYKIVEGKENFYDREELSEAQ